jgi:hypothetical protein
MNVTTLKGEGTMTDFQFRAIIELFKSVVRELHDEEKIIERLEQIKRGEFDEQYGKHMK